MSMPPEVLLIHGHSAKAAGLRPRLDGLGVRAVDHALDNVARAADSLRADLALLLLDPEDVEKHGDSVNTLLSRLSDDHVATLVWGWPADGRPYAGPLVDWAPPDCTVDEIVGRLSTLSHYAPLLRRFEREFDHLQRLGKQLNRYFSEIDQEMRLAGRLQRDFLPTRLPQVRPLRFAAIYRPATWVSGDMYDVFRIDERHIGLYVADAMGHGIAAGLMTMFLRQALVVKDITDTDYSIVDPAVAMANLNSSLVKQNLPNCQFVTAVYAIVNSATRELRIARGGHPRPLLIRGDGAIEEIPVDGPLLGLTDVPASFAEHRLVLQPGEKVLMYTDGIEEALLTPQEQPDAPPIPTQRLCDWSRLSADGMIEALATHLDRQEGSLHPADDVTAVVVEVER